MSDADRVAACLTEWLDRGGSLLFMTDYDGTLTPLVSDPAQARLDPAVRGHLAALARSRLARVAVISGRDLEDLRARVAVPEVVYAGCHGLEVEGPGLRFVHPEAAAQEETVRALGEALSRRAFGIPGLRVEPKRLSVAVHYRGVPSQDTGRVEMEVARAVREQGGGFRVLRGIEVMEVLPRVSWDKGACARWLTDRLLGALPSAAKVSYMGDDWTDEYCFEALSGQALTVRVGAAVPVSRAEYHLEDVAQAQGLLAALASSAGGAR